MKKSGYHVLAERLLGEEDAEELEGEEAPAEGAGTDALVENLFNQTVGPDRNGYPERHEGNTSAEEAATPDEGYAPPYNPSNEPPSWNPPQPTPPSSQPTSPPPPSTPPPSPNLERTSLTPPATTTTTASRSIPETSRESLQRRKFSSRSTAQDAKHETALRRKSTMSQPRTDTSRKRRRLPGGTRMTGYQILGETVGEGFDLSSILSMFTGGMVSGGGKKTGGDDKASLRQAQLQEEARRAKEEAARARTIAWTVGGAAGAIGFGIVLWKVLAR